MDKIKQALIWLANRYASLPFYLQYIMFGIMAAPGVGIFLGVYFGLHSMGEDSFLRWILAVIPAMAYILGLVITMSKVVLPSKKDK